MAKPDPKPPEVPKPTGKTISTPVVIREGAGWSLYLVDLPESQVKAGTRVHAEDMRAIVEGKAMQILERR